MKSHPPKSSPASSAGQAFKGRLPSFFVRWYGAGRWDWLAVYFRRRADRYADGYLKKYGRAVERVKQEFRRLVNPSCNPPFGKGGTDGWDRQIVLYVKSLGIGALIKDMREAFGKNPNIQSLIYFMHTEGGASRWENLLMAKIQKELAKEKREYLEDLNVIDIHLNTHLCLPSLEGGNHIKEIEPEWVADARKRLKHFENVMTVMAGSGDIDKWEEANRQAEKIRARLKNRRFEP